MVTTPRSLTENDYLKIATYWFLLVRRDLLLALRRHEFGRWQGANLGIPESILQECLEGLDKDWTCMRLVAAELRDQICPEPPCFAPPNDNQLRQVLVLLVTFAHTQ